MLDVAAFLVQAAEQLVDDPVARAALPFSALGDGLEVVGVVALGDEHVGVVSREAVVLHEAGALLVRQLRAGAASGHPRKPA